MSEWTNLETRTDGRPDFRDPNFGITLAKKFPPYVFSLTGNAALVHKVLRVEVRWYDCRGDYLVRRHTPRLVAWLVCGNFRFLESRKARTCVVPAPDAVLCGRCHGEPVNFPRNRPHVIDQRVAHVRLGCVSEAQP